MRGSAFHSSSSSRSRFAPLRQSVPSASFSASATSRSFSTLASAVFCGALGLAGLALLGDHRRRARRAGRPGRPGRRPRWRRSPGRARSCTDSAASSGDITPDLIRCSSRSTSKASASYRSVKNASASSGVPSGYCPTGALAVGGPDVDGSVLGDASPLGRRDSSLQSLRSFHGSARPRGRHHASQTASPPGSPSPPRSDDGARRGASIVCRGADRRLPRRSVGHQLLRRGHRPGRGVRGHRPRQGRRRRRRRGRPRAPAQAGRRAGHPRPRRPHVVRRPGRRHVRRHRLDPPARPAPARRPDGRHVARRPPRCCSAASYEFAEPDDVARARRRPGARAGRPRRSSSTTRPGHTEGSVTFRTPYDERGRLRGDVLRRPAVRRLDRPHRPARRRPPDDAAQPAPQGAAAAPTTSWCCPATASRPPSAASAPPTRSCSTSSSDADAAARVTRGL